MFTEDEYIQMIEMSLSLDNHQLLYGIIIENIETFPDWVLLGIMSACPGDINESIFDLIVDDPKFGNIMRKWNQDSDLFITFNMSGKSTHKFQKQELITYLKEKYAN